MNDLIQSQQHSHVSDLNSDPQSYSNGSTPKCSPSPSLLHHSQPQTSDNRAHMNTTGDVTRESMDHSQQSTHSHINTSDRHISEINHSKQNHDHQQSQTELREHIQAMPTTHPSTSFPLVDVGDQSLPPLHPDVLQQRFTASDISMLPVPRIMYAGSSEGGAYRAGGGVTFMSQLGGADFTLDENTQMADMIALKYLGKKSGLTDLNEVPGK